MRHISALPPAPALVQHSSNASALNRTRRGVRPAPHTRTQAWLPEPVEVGEVKEGWGRQGASLRPWKPCPCMTLESRWKSSEIHQHGTWKGHSCRGIWPGMRVHGCPPGSRAPRTDHPRWWGGVKPGAAAPAEMGRASGGGAPPSGTLYGGGEGPGGEEGGPARGGLPGLSSTRRAEGAQG